MERSVQEDCTYGGDVSLCSQHKATSCQAKQTDIDKCKEKNCERRPRSPQKSSWRPSEDYRHEQRYEKEKEKEGRKTGTNERTNERTNDRKERKKERKKRKKERKKERKGGKKRRKVYDRIRGCVPPSRAVSSFPFLFAFIVIILSCSPKSAGTCPCTVLTGIMDGGTPPKWRHRNVCIFSV